jgi:hypothetical protein
LQVRSYFEDAAFAFDVIDEFVARAIGNVFAENDDPSVALHLRVQTTIDQVDHRAGVAAQLNLDFGVELLRGRIDLR